MMHRDNSKDRLLRGHTFIVPPSLATFTSPSRILSIRSTLDKNCQNRQQENNNTRNSRYDHGRLALIPIIRPIRTSLIHTTDPTVSRIDVIDTQPIHRCIIRVGVTRLPVAHGGDGICVFQRRTRDSKGEALVTSFIALVVAIF